MKTTTLKLALGLSVLFNLGVLTALGWQQLAGYLPSLPSEPLLVRELQLDEQQRQQWLSHEAPFLHELNESSLTISQRRDELIDSIFAEQLDDQRIANAQSALAEQQNHQQRLVVEQLLRERAILNPAQRQRLAQLLTRDSALSSQVDMLHND